MYFLEDRMKAVQLCIDSGYDEVVVLQTLGYPSPNALRQWHREYKQTETLHRKVKRKIQYTKGQIKAAVEYYDEHEGAWQGQAGRWDIRIGTRLVCGSERPIPTKARCL